MLYKDLCRCTAIPSRLCRSNCTRANLSCSFCVSFFSFSFGSTFCVFGLDGSGNYLLFFVFVPFRAVSFRPTWDQFLIHLSLLPLLTYVHCSVPSHQGLRCVIQVAFDETWQGNADHINHTCLARLLLIFHQVCDHRVCSIRNVSHGTCMFFQWKKSMNCYKRIECHSLGGATGNTFLFL